MSARTYHSGVGGAGCVQMVELDVSPGQQFPVVVGAGGTRGAYINVNGWAAACNGGTGGTSSFGSYSVIGGGGAVQNVLPYGGTTGNGGIYFVGPGHDAAPTSGWGVAVGSTPGGRPTLAKYRNEVIVQSGTAGAPGFVLVEW